MDVAAKIWDPIKRNCDSDSVTILFFVNYFHTNLIKAETKPSEKTVHR